MATSPHTRVQDVPLLRTKLYIPPVRPELVSRPRLIERLNAGLDRKLTLISAPAGFGKTTLLSDWVHHRAMGKGGGTGAGIAPLPVAWLSLDEEDNDPVRFLTYVIAALRTIHEGLGATALAMLQSPQPPPIQAILTTLINEIDAIPEGDHKVRPCILVFDDYHVVEAQLVDDALTFLLDHLPPPPGGMHLVIAGRTDPSLPLSRLRAGDQMTEIRVNDLRFTHGEVANFLEQAMGLELSAENVIALETRTEGWIAGLQLAALSMQREHPDHIPRFVQSFTGSHRYIVDYLTDEVLQWQPRGTREFLLRTSILNRLSGPLCDAVTERENSQPILETLEAANLFIVPLDGERHWYRYHHLFVDLLRQRLRRVHPKQIPELHRRASAWYQQHGLIPEAVSHALAAKDFEGAARLIEPIGFLIMTRSEWSTLTTWLEAMPEGFVRTRPWLCIFQAWMSRRAGRYDAVQERVRCAERALRAPDTPVDGDEAQVVRAHIALLRAYIAIFEGEIPRAVESAHRALEYFPPADMIRGAVWMILGMASRMTGDLMAANQAFAECRSMAQAADNVFLTHIATWHLGYTQLLQGRLHQAATTYREALELASEQGERRILFSGQPHTYLGEIYREWNELESAETHLMEGVRLCEPTRLLDALTDGYVALARVRLAQGDLHAALAAYQRAQGLLQVPSPDPVNVVRVDQCRIRLWLAQGDLAEAARWVRESGLSVDDEIDFKRELEHIVLAHVLVALGREQSGGSHIDDALELLARLLQMAEKAGLVGKAIEILVLQSLALQAQGETEGALTALEGALSLAEPEGFVRVFVDEGQPMAELLRQAVSRGVMARYASQLLDAFEVETKDERPKMIPPSPSIVVRPVSPRGEAGWDSSSLVEPLSERELEVVQLVAAGLTNREIALELTIAVSTVKTHLKSVYAKLDVRNRTQAAARARELNLLS